MPRNRPGRPKTEGEGRRKVVLGMLGSPEYAEWLKKANETTGIPKTGIVRHAIKLWAEANGIPEPPLK